MSATAAIILKERQIDINKHLKVSVDDALDRCGVWGAHHWLLLLYTGIAWTYYSMQIMISSFLGAAVACQWDLNTSQEGVLTSVVFAGE